MKPDPAFTSLAAYLRIGAGEAAPLNELRDRLHERLFAPGSGSRRKTTFDLGDAEVEEAAFLLRVRARHALEESPSTEVTWYHHPDRVWRPSLSRKDHAARVQRLSQRRGHLLPSDLPNGLAWARASLRLVESSAAHLHCAIHLSSQGEFKAARGHAERALEIAPSAVFVGCSLEQIARAECLMGNIDESIGYAKRAVQSDLPMPRVWFFFLACVRADASLMEYAARCLDEFVPSDHEVLNSFLSALPRRFLRGRKLPALNRAGLGETSRKLLHAFH